MLTSRSSPSVIAESAGSCLHCGSTAIADGSGSPFCCGGCERVYSLLNREGLGEYYALREKFGSPSGVAPASLGQDSFGYLDDPEFRATFADGDGKTMRFHLEGVHCVACVWLVERIPTLVPGVRRVALDLSSAIATVEVADGGAFGPVAEAFQGHGYRPHPVERSEADRRQKNDARLSLLRLGVAAAGSGNIMLLAVAAYAGVSPDFAIPFRWISFGLYLPVLFFSAAPFFGAARDSLRKRRLAIDVPIAFGISIGTFASIVGLLTGTGETYFDSLAGLIFLLLASRYLLLRVQASAADATHLIHFLAPSRAKLRVAPAGYREVKSESLRAGDEVEVFPGEIVPVDGVLVLGSSHVSASWLTGEAKPVRVSEGDPVAAGSLNVSAPIRVRVTASGAETRLAEIVRRTAVALESRSPSLVLADRLARVFVPATFAMIALGFAIGSRVSFETGILRAMAVAIVACPCSLALAIPLVMGRTIGLLAKRGVLIRGSEVIERLSRVRTIFFDKTGTLTGGTLTVTGWAPAREGLERIVLGLESKSIHPVANAIRDHFRGFVPAEVSGLEERLGEGVGGVVDGTRYFLGRFDGGREGTEVALFEAGRCIATVAFGDAIRPTAERAIAELAAMGIPSGILSGDQESAVEAVAKRLGIPTDRVYAARSPEAKARIVGEIPECAMVGDGVNDAVALASASVGIAVYGGMEASLRAAGIYAASGEPIEVVRLVRIARETMKVIRRNLAFTIVYNVVVVSVAMAGLLSPLFAAVIMPVSALIVFGLSIGGTRVLRSELRGVGR